MKILRTIKQTRKYLAGVRAEGRSLGFVPTMGYLHEGHLSLMRRAKKETGSPLISIFVNPTQFGPGEDYRRYPRDLKQDERSAEEAGVEAIFYPSVKEMYPENYSTRVEVAGLSGVLCGASRPGHFRGVTTVVLKLLNIIDPDVAYFGRKDVQQAVLINRMVRDLNMKCKIRILPTVREKDGLAMSSRNTYLSQDEREDAVILYQSLQKAQAMVKSEIRDSKKIISAMRRMVKGRKTARIDYIAIVDPVKLAPVRKISGDVLLALAVWIGKARLIDNLFLKKKRDGRFFVSYRL